MIEVDDDAFDRAYLDPLRRIAVAATCGAKSRRDLMDFDTKPDSLVWENRVTDVAIDAELVDLERHVHSLTHGAACLRPLAQGFARLRRGRTTARLLRLDEPHVRTGTRQCLLNAIGIGWDADEQNYDILE